MKGELDEL